MVYHTWSTGTAGRRIVGLLVRGIVGASVARPFLKRPREQAVVGVWACRRANNLRSSASTLCKSWLLIDGACFNSRGCVVVG